MLNIFFLGDMSFGKGSRDADYWLSKLNGNIYFIRGFEIKKTGERNQHDRISRKENVFDNLIITFKRKKFYLVHDPEQVPNIWDVSETIFWQRIARPALAL